MPAPKKRINIELHLSLSATFLSLAALIVSVFQTKIAREQQQASVWPRLAVEASILDKNFTYTIANQGVGPAVIKKVTVSYQGIVYPSLYALMMRHTGPLNGGFFHRDLQSEGVLKAGDEVNIFNLARNDEALSSKLGDVVSDTSFHLRVHYADVYGNCWLLDRNKVVELSDCPEP
ncbi:hypothetical protein GCM10028805_29020 [Spirosoma harenae]